MLIIVNVVGIPLSLLTIAGGHILLCTPFAMAVLIARQAGGNLAQLMLHLSALVRERIALRGSVRVMSAEGRLSAWILGILPFVIAALVGLMNPAFLRVLWTDPAGLNLVWLALGGIGLGVLWMRSIIRIRV